MTQSVLTTVNLDFLGPKVQGKVRDIYDLGEQLLIVTTDRLSAFDRILGHVPYKGQVLNQLSAFWFKQLEDIVPNHLLTVPDPNVILARKCSPLPVEVVVRGYISGVTDTSLWRRYELGERSIYGMDFPDGMRKNEPLPKPIITPTTKAQDGGHDQRITADEIVSSGLIDADLWAQISDVAIKIFRRGQEVSQQGGLMLVDTKYEFGLDADGKLTLIDEVHTPDSSRFWLAESYVGRMSQGEEPENYDKEFIRLHYASHGYTGAGDPPMMPAALAEEASERYRTTFEMITGEPFLPSRLPAESRIIENIKQSIG